MVQIIVNPSAGHGKAQFAATKASEILQARSIAHRIHETEYAMHASKIAMDCVKDKKTTAIYCIGGDGTVHEVVGGMAGSDIPLGLIPAGSGNDFIASMKNYKKTSVQDLVERFIGGHTEKIDIIRCMSGGRVFHCANIASFGLDSEIVENASKNKKRFGKFAYLASTLGTILQYKKKKMKITADTHVIDSYFTLSAICNGKVYGGGFKIAPSASISDGKITLCMIKEMSAASMAFLFPSVLVGLHTKLSPVNFINCEKVEICFEGILSLNIDGNIYPVSAPVDFEIVKGLLTVFV